MADVLVLEKVSRALGLAQAIAEPIGPAREGGNEEVAAEIVALLGRVRDSLLAEIPEHAAPFKPSPARQGLDLLLTFYPHFDLLAIEWQIDEHPTLGIPVSFGPWILVKLGQPSEGLAPAFAVWHFAIWRNTGAVHTMRGPDGEVSDDPIFTPVASDV